MGRYYKYLCGTKVQSFNEGQGQEVVQTPQTFLPFLTFSSFCIHLVARNCWSFSRVLTKLVLTASACLLVFAVEDGAWCGVLCHFTDVTIHFEHFCSSLLSLPPSHSKLALKGWNRATRQWLRAQIWSPTPESKSYCRHFYKQVT